jgi:hypothetical protein
MVFSIIRVEDKVELHRATERELRAKLIYEFELLEMHKNQQVAQDRLKELRRTQFKKKRKTWTVSSEGRRNNSLAKRGTKNPMSGPISEERRRNISLAQRGNQYRKGKKLNAKQLVEHSKRSKRMWKKRKLRNEKRRWCHCPDSGKELLVLEDKGKPEHFVWGRSPERMEVIRFGLRIVNKRGVSENEAN